MSLSCDQLPVTSFFRKKDTNMFSWLCWIIEDLLPFNFCEKQNARLFSKLLPVTAITLKESMGKLCFLVEEKIKTILPDMFALAFDGWTASSTHYLAVFAIVPDSKKPAGYEKALLSFAPLIHDEDLSADSHHETIYEILQTFGKNFSNIACIIGDNCSVNQSLARKCKCYLVGCASHRLNLGVQQFLGSYSDVIDGVRQIMISLRTIKNRAALRKKTPLSPILDNATRWSSKFEMLKRYVQLRDYIDDIVPVQLQLSPSINSNVSDLLKQLGQLDTLTKFLQTEDRQFYEVRKAFDEAAKLFPCLEQHCSEFSEIVCDPHFEIAVCKIQENQIYGEPLKLTPTEYKQVKHLKKHSDQVTGDTDCEDLGRTDEMVTVLQRVKRSKVQASSNYIDLQFVRPTRNICERFFSISKLAMPDYRKRLLPSSLEMQLFLKVNRHGCGIFSYFTLTRNN